MERAISAICYKCVRGIARNWKRNSLLNCRHYVLVGSNPIPSTIIL